MSEPHATPNTASHDPLTAARSALRAAIRMPEAEAIERLLATAALSTDDRAAISTRGAALVAKVRADDAPGMMEAFLAEYGLSTREGIALMCLAEALLRVPDSTTIDALIRDKIAPGDWSRHLGHSSSPFVNASSWALMLTGKVLSEDDGDSVADQLHSLIRRLGEPVVRAAVARAMREMGKQFVLGRTIEEAVKRGKRRRDQGYTHSFDMLGEAARTEQDALRYLGAYSAAIAYLARQSNKASVRENPGISVKLSALYPRYELTHREAVLEHLAPRLLGLCQQAARAGIGLNIDAEEADRLDLSLDVIADVLPDPALAGWDGFGVVVQAYGQRAPHVLDWLHALAERHDRRIMVRLVKGAYWDTEIKRAQTLGLDGFPVFTRKAATDVSYIACARKLLAMRGRVYPQFATHNAHTAAAILHMAGEDRTSFEFQRLHGMGEALHDQIRAEGAGCRIYAPVGAHRDLLAYLVRRLLENGANSSFVHQIVDKSIAPEEIARDPFAEVESLLPHPANPAIATGPALFAPTRANAAGWDLGDPEDIARYDAARAPFRTHRWDAAPLTAADGDGPVHEVRNPARPGDVVGTVRDATPSQVDEAVAAARAAQPGWEGQGATSRAQALSQAAKLYEDHAGEFFAILAREAGKTPLDAIAELREAVDFLHYYAAEAARAEKGGTLAPARGVFACISPWNFPLAIFTGQIAAALAAGNAVIAKPAEQTPLIAHRAVRLLHEAGVPEAVLHLLPGDGPTVGGPLTAHPGIDGVAFTGSTETAHRIRKGMAATGAAEGVLIAETGGLNAMIVDSTALPEQAVRDILASAFQSAGQRCSALRVLYVQEDVAHRTLEMLTGAMDSLRVGDPWEFSTDVGPVIDEEARATIMAHVEALTDRGAEVKRLDLPEEGIFAPPSVYRVPGIEVLEREIFGPVLHVATFRADDLAEVVEDVNETGYGLTFGLHTRIDDRVEEVVGGIEAGNVYVNRNQIGAIVASQPFGGEGLSGTGPKAGGPNYVARFTRAGASLPAAEDHAAEQPHVGMAEVQAAFAKLDAEAWARREDRVAALHAAIGALAAGQGAPALAAPMRAALDAMQAVAGRAGRLPGPTGEQNRLTVHPRGAFLCLGALDGHVSPLAVLGAQAMQVLALGGSAVLAGAGAEPLAEALRKTGAPVAALHGHPAPEVLTSMGGMAGAAATGSRERLRPYAEALAARPGAILPLVTDVIAPEAYIFERALCIDTTAAGGNAELLAASGG